MMTNLLEQAFHEIEKLSEERQNAIAARLLADLADERQWAEQFAATTDSQWDNMAAMVRKEIENGNIERLDSIFPSQSSK